jgi:hypothetical protein
MRERIHLYCRNIKNHIFRHEFVYQIYLMLFYIFREISLRHNQIYMSVI